MTQMAPRSPEKEGAALDAAEEEKRPTGACPGSPEKASWVPPPARHEGTFVECEHGPGPSGLKGPVLGDA